MKRREALVSLAVSGASVVLTACATGQVSSAGPSEDQVRLLVRALDGVDLQPGQAPQVLASLKANRFTADVDPTIQPADFDPDLDH